ncbi:hypothetical protein HDZ31DRAFT_72670 [Schizophyllum fasciatum]
MPPRARATEITEGTPTRRTGDNTRGIGEARHATDKAIVDDLSRTSSGATKRKAASESGDMARKRKSLASTRAASARDVNQTHSSAGSRASASSHDASKSSTGNTSSGDSTQAAGWSRVWDKGVEKTQWLMPLGAPRKKPPAQPLSTTPPAPAVTQPKTLNESPSKTKVSKPLPAQTSSQARLEWLVAQAVIEPKRVDFKHLFPLVARNAELVKTWSLVPVSRGRASGKTGARSRAKSARSPDAGHESRDARKEVHDLDQEPKVIWKKNVIQKLYPKSSRLDAHLPAPKTS